MNDVFIAKVWTRFEDYFDDVLLECSCCENNWFEGYWEAYFDGWIYVETVQWGDVVPWRGPIYICKRDYHHWIIRVSIRPLTCGREGVIILQKDHNHLHTSQLHKYKTLKHTKVYSTFFFYIALSARREHTQESRDY